MGETRVLTAMIMGGMALGAALSFGLMSVLDQPRAGEESVGECASRCAIGEWPQVVSWPGGDVTIECVPLPADASRDR